MNQDDGDYDSYELKDRKASRFKGERRQLIEIVSGHDMFSNDHMNTSSADLPQRDTTTLGQYATATLESHPNNISIINQSAGDNLVQQEPDSANFLTPPLPAINASRPKYVETQAVADDIKIQTNTPTGTSIRKSRKSNIKLGAV